MTWVIVICASFFLSISSLVYYKSRRKFLNPKSVLGSRYETLQNLIRTNQKVTSEKHSSKTLALNVVDDQDIQSYALTEVDGRLIVVWTLNSVVFGKRGKEWSFSAAYAQEKMFEEIVSDIEHYKKMLFRER